MVKSHRMETGHGLSPREPLTLSLTKPSFLTSPATARAEMSLGSREHYAQATVNLDTNVSKVIVCVRMGDGPVPDFYGAGYMGDSNRAYIWKRVNGVLSIISNSFMSGNGGTFKLTGCRQHPYILRQR